jgi:hypothetical protein
MAAAAVVVGVEAVDAAVEAEAEAAAAGEEASRRFRRAPPSPSRLVQTAR